VPCETEEKLLHVVSGITQNLALHPTNRTRLYKAELHGSLALDKLIEQVSVWPAACVLNGRPPCQHLASGGGLLHVRGSIGGAVGPLRAPPARKVAPAARV